MLTGIEIAAQVKARRIRIDPFDAVNLKANSYEYHLAPSLKRLTCNALTKKGVAYLDPRVEMTYEELVIPEEGYLLKPAEAYLGSTLERFGSDYYASLVTGSEATASLFIKNHACAGLIDQGFYNFITLEITVKLPTVLYPNMLFGQIFWFESVGECDLYKGKYALGSNAASPSKIHKDVRS